MGSLVLGLLCGGVLAVLICFLLWAIIDYFMDVKSLTIVSIFIVITTSALLINLSKNDSIKWCQQYQISKETIHKSIDNEKLSGFERVELVKQATELNQNLIGKQYDCQKWYGFDMDKSVLELTPIELD